MKFLFASMNTLTNSKDCSKSCIQFLFPLSFVHIGRISLVYIQDHVKRLSEQLLELQAAIGKPE
jgi:hypothetical protein